MRLWLTQVLAWLIALAVLAGAGWFTWQRWTAAPAAAAATGGRSAGSVPVEVADVGVGTLVDRRTFTATMEPRATFVVAPKITGRLEKLHVSASDTIKTGQVIAEIDDAEYQQEVARAQAELVVGQARLAQAKSALEIARREHSRLESLRDRKVASESELDAALATMQAREADVKAAEAELDRHQANLSSAKIMLSYTRIHVAWEDDQGPRVVGERFVDAGAMMTPNTSIISVIDLDPMVASFFVTEKEYGRLKLDMPATITTVAHRGRTFTGKVIRLAPLFRELSRQARVEIDVPNPDGELKPGMFARIDIELGRADNATWVPVQAIVKRQGNAGVFLVSDDGGTVRFIPTETGIEDGRKVQVLKPALSGRVVTLGHHLLLDKSKISIADTPSAGGSTE